MSAFIVSDLHVNALVSFAANHKITFWDQEAIRRIQITWHNAEEIGRILLAENMRSVDHRYRGLTNEQVTADATYKFRRVPSDLIPAVAIVKSCHCLEYQSCEHDGWKKSQAHSIVRAIERKAIECIPGYDKAPWGIDDFSKFDPRLAPAKAR